LVAFGALCDLLDAITTDWITSYGAGPGAFANQGSSSPGVTTGRDVLGAAAARTKAITQRLVSLPGVVANAPAV
jgi:hypothetical protein